MNTDMKSTHNIKPYFVTFVCVRYSDWSIYLRIRHSEPRNIVWLLIVAEKCVVAITTKQTCVARRSTIMSLVVDPKQLDDVQEFRIYFQCKSLRLVLACNVLEVVANWQNLRRGCVVCRQKFQDVLVLFYLSLRLLNVWCRSTNHNTRIKNSELQNVCEIITRRQRLYRPCVSLTSRRHRHSVSVHWRHWNSLLPSINWVGCSAPGRQVHVTTTTCSMNCQAELEGTDVFRKWNTLSPRLHGRTGSDRYSCFDALGMQWRPLRPSAVGVVTIDAVCNFNPSGNRSLPYKLSAVL